MAQAKRKTASKTAKRPASRSTACRKKASTRTAKCKEITGIEKVHLCVIASMSIVAGILLCADAAMMIVK